MTDVDLTALSEWWRVCVGIGLVALISTVIIESSVSSLFRIGWRGIGAVALVNLLTNPIYNLALFLVVFSAGLPPTGTTVLGYVLVPVFEIVVVIAEWRLLSWTLGETAGSSRKLLALSISMNVLSAMAGPLAFYLVTRGANTLFS